MAKILITGADGMLGHDLCPVLKNFGHTVVGTDIASLDITDLEQVRAILAKENPDFVINCAAYTNVDKAEENLEMARKINTGGTENLAKICAENGITLIYISTDYVFDGTKGTSYLPKDTPNPLNNYGLTKWEGEKAVQENCEKYYICRTSWLYGKHGKNFVETMLSLADKPELKVVDDQKGCPTWTVDLSNAIGEIIEKNLPYGIYHTCGGGCTTWYGFAKEIFEQAGVSVNLKPCNTDEFPRPAKRPAFSAMENGNLCRDWKLALKDYMKIRK